MIRTKLAELELIENIKDKIHKFAKIEVIGESQEENLRLPIHKITMGNPSPKAPVLGIIGGVHGLERIGSQVSLSLLNSISQLYQWDETIQKKLETIRIFFIPIVNPIGILRKRRSNPRGVDIMRNAPIDADDKVPFLLGGHNISNLLPWYRGNRLEPETHALISHVQKEIEFSEAAITLDLHSGFGFQDQLWFPYAKTRKPIQNISHLYGLVEMLNSTYPNHFYKIEPQAYLTHGDVWDYMYDWKIKNNTPGVYLPLSLEMGSWMWVKKNPMQIFLTDGAYNPVKTHRYKRALRRHITLFEFLLKSLYSPKNWVNLSEAQIQENKNKALSLWYPNEKK